MPAAPQRWYVGQRGLEYHAGKRAIPESAFPWVCNLRAEKIQPYVEVTDSILEHGVGLGWNLASLHCRERTGVDLEPSLGPRLEQLGIHFLTSTSSLAADSFEVVLCHHMLEHVLSPPEVLQECARLLKPRGRLLLFVPWEKEARYRRFDPAEPNHHLYSWNAQTLGNLVSECGLRVERAEVRRFGYDRFAAIQAVRLHLREKGYRMLRQLALGLRPGWEVFITGRKESSLP